MGRREGKKVEVTSVSKNMVYVIEMRHKKHKATR